MRRNNDSDERRTDLSRRKVLGLCAVGILGSPAVSASGRSVESTNPPSTDASAFVAARRREREAAEGRRKSLVESTTPAAVEFSAQTSDGRAVTVDSVTIPKDGFVAIHDARLRRGKPIESVVGVSERLAPGYHENVEVALFDVPGATYDRTKLEDDQTLVAMPHEDTDTNRRYEFVESDGTEDPSYAIDGEPVTESACVTVDDC